MVYVRISSPKEEEEKGVVKNVYPIDMQGNGTEKSCVDFSLNVPPKRKYVVILPSKIK